MLSAVCQELETPQGTAQSIFLTLGLYCPGEEMDEQMREFQRERVHEMVHERRRQQLMQVNPPSVGHRKDPCGEGGAQAHADAQSHRRML